MGCLYRLGKEIGRNDSGMASLVLRQGFLLSEFEAEGMIFSMLNQIVS